MMQSLLRSIAIIFMHTDTSGKPHKVSMVVRKIGILLREAVAYTALCIFFFAQLLIFVWLNGHELK